MNNAFFVWKLQMKKFRFELQKAVNTPVNAISPVSRAHLLDILKRLQTLLRGQVVHVSDKSISACSVPEGIDFCKNLVARMIAVSNLRWLFTMQPYFHLCPQSVFKTLYIKKPYKFGDQSRLLYLSQTQPRLQDWNYLKIKL